MPIKIEYIEPSKLPDQEKNQPLPEGTAGERRPDSQYSTVTTLDILRHLKKPSSPESE